MIGDALLKIQELASSMQKPARIGRVRATNVTQA